MSKNEVKKVLKVLTEDESSMAANWSRRFKNNMEKLHSGDPYQVAEVAAEPRDPRAREGPVRRREAHDPEGPPDPDLRAAYATGNSEEEAEAMIDDVLEKAHGGRVPRRALATHRLPAPARLGGTLAVRGRRKDPGPS